MTAFWLKQNWLQKQYIDIVATLLFLTCFLGMHPQPIYFFLLLNHKSADDTYYYINDHLGAPQIITDDSGNVVWQAESLAFGNVSISGAQIENNLRFPGQSYDAETGLHYNWKRYYSAEVRKYLAAGMNLYAYVEDDPMNGLDFEGLKPKFEPATPEEGCEYYKERCECGEDEYACKVYDCCQVFGDDSTSNCIRGCLVAYDKRNCKDLQGEARNKCRRIEHWECYGRCLGHGKGIKELTAGPPEACIDAMNEVGGMGF